MNSSNYTSKLVLALLVACAAIGPVFADDTYKQMMDNEEKISSQTNDAAIKSTTKQIYEALKGLPAGIYNGALYGIKGVTTIFKSAENVKGKDGKVVEAQYTWKFAAGATVTVVVIAGIIYATYKFADKPVVKKTLGALKAVATSKWTYFTAVPLLLGGLSYRLKDGSFSNSAKAAGSVAAIFGLAYSAYKLGGWALGKFGIGFGKKEEAKFDEAALIRALNAKGDMKIDNLQELVEKDTNFWNSNNQKNKRTANKLTFQARLEKFKNKMQDGDTKDKLSNAITKFSNGQQKEALEDIAKLVTKSK